MKNTQNAPKKIRTCKKQCRHRYYCNFYDRLISTFSIISTAILFQDTAEDKLAFSEIENKVYSDIANICSAYEKE